MHPTIDTDNPKYINHIVRGVISSDISPKNAAILLEKREAELDALDVYKDALLRFIYDIHGYTRDRGGAALHYQPYVLFKIETNPEEEELGQQIMVFTKKDGGIFAVNYEAFVRGGYEVMYFDYLEVKEVFAESPQLCAFNIVDGKAISAIDRAPKEE